MGKILVIGSAVADVIIRLEDHLPVKGEDVHVLSQEMRPGGCAFNVYNMIRRFDADAIPFFPVGTGPYADFMEKAMKELGIVSAAPHADEPNGCCYCFIEADGERTFIVYHGAEYRFKKEWLEALDTEEIDMCYICGLEIEERTGEVIVDFLEKNPHIEIVFAPGPRIGKIDPSLLRRIFSLHPILHLNEAETEECARIIGEWCPADSCDVGKDAAEISLSCPAGNLKKLLSCTAAIHAATSRSVITTLGKDGCIYCTSEAATAGQSNPDAAPSGEAPSGSGSLTAAPGKPVFGYVPPYPATQVDTTGAGDGHAGAAIAMLHAGASLPVALDRANKMASLVVGTAGALLK